VEHVFGMELEHQVLVEKVAEEGKEENKKENRK
jgi:hypothetical protein